MTTIVTPATMTAAYNSLSSSQQNDFKTALGLSSSGSGGTGASNGVAIPKLTLPGTGPSVVILATLQVPTSGRISVRGNCNVEIAGGTLNGTITAGGFMMNLLLSSSPKGAVGSSTSANSGEIVAGSVFALYAPTGAASGHQLGGDISAPYLQVSAGQYLTLYGLMSTQGTSSTAWQTVTSSDHSVISVNANALGYQYI